MIPRYSLPEMSAVWSDQTKLQIWLRIEVLASEAWAELGRIPPQDLEKIQKRARFSIDRVLEIERTTQHDVAAFVQNVAENVGEAPDMRASNVRRETAARASTKSGWALSDTIRWKVSPHRSACSRAPTSTS